MAKQVDLRIREGVNCEGLAGTKNLGEREAQERNEVIESIDGVKNSILIQIYTLLDVSLSDLGDQIERIRNEDLQKILRILFDRLKEDNWNSLDVNLEIGESMIHSSVGEDAESLRIMSLLIGLVHIFERYQESEQATNSRVDSLARDIATSQKKASTMRTALKKTPEFERNPKDEAALEREEGYLKKKKGKEQRAKKRLSSLERVFGEFLKDLDVNDLDGSFKKIEDFITYLKDNNWLDNAREAQMILDFLDLSNFADFDFRLLEVKAAQEKVQKVFNKSKIKKKGGRLNFNKEHLAKAKKEAIAIRRLGSVSGVLLLLVLLMIFGEQIFKKDQPKTRPAATEKKKGTPLLDTSYEMKWGGSDGNAVHFNPDALPRMTMPNSEVSILIKKMDGIMPSPKPYDSVQMMGNVNVEWEKDIDDVEYMQFYSNLQRKELSKEEYREMIFEAALAALCEEVAKYDIKDFEMIGGFSFAMIPVDIAYMGVEDGEMLIGKIVEIKDYVEGSGNGDLTLRNVKMDVELGVPDLNFEVEFSISFARK